jgi:hypothetical protein
MKPTVTPVDPEYGLWDDPRLTAEDLIKRLGEAVAEIEKEGVGVIDKTVDKVLNEFLPACEMEIEWRKPGAPAVVVRLPPHIFEEVLSVDLKAILAAWFDEVYPPDWEDDWPACIGVWIELEICVG